jgi:hypothetical protein
MARKAVWKPYFKNFSIGLCVCMRIFQLVQA